MATATPLPLAWTTMLSWPKTWAVWDGGFIGRFREARGEGESRTAMLTGSIGASSPDTGVDMGGGDPGIAGRPAALDRHAASRLAMTGAGDALWRLAMMG